MESRTSKRPDIHPFQELYISLGSLIRKTGEELKKLMDKNPFVQTVVNVAIQQIIIMVFQLAFTKQAKIADIKTPIPSPIGTTGWGIGDDGLPFDYSCGEWYEDMFYRGGKNNLSHPLNPNGFTSNRYTGSWELGEGAHPISSAAAAAPPAPRHLSNCGKISPTSGFWMR
jgi:hypothetical protein